MVVLESERLLFREHEPGDLDAYCAMEADPEVRRYVGGAPRSRRDAEQKFRDTHLRHASEELALRATIFKPTNLYIGYCGLYPHFGADGAVSGEAVLAFYLAREYWGRGLATEAGRAAVIRDFDSSVLERELQVDKSHDPSERHIRCPLCGWSPRKGDRWFCECSHSWNTFDTGGVCPACLHQWMETQCLACSRWSTHTDWYAGD